MTSHVFHTHDFNGKEIFHFNDHATAILPWARLAKKHDHSPLLITLDHHTDTNSAWLRSLYQQVGRDLPKMESLRVERLESINPLEEDDLLIALKDLRHDEHIDLALRLGILTDVVVVQHSFANPLPEWKERGINVLPFDPGLLENKSSVSRAFFDRALEDDWLAPLIDSLPNTLNPWERPFILDIDLDYFKTEKSLNPQQGSTFQRLARESIAITVAEEQGWVDRLWLDTPPQSGQLFNQLLTNLHP